MSDENLNDMYERITAEVMTDLSVLPFETSVQRFWLLLSCIQYTWRDTSLSVPMRDTLRSMGDNIAKRIIARHPESARLIQAGWDVTQDVPTGSLPMTDDDDDVNLRLWWMPFN